MSHEPIMQVAYYFLEDIHMSLDDITVKDRTKIALFTTDNGGSRGNKTPMLLKSGSEFVFDIISVEGAKNIIENGAEVKEAFLEYEKYKFTINVNDKYYFSESINAKNKRHKKHEAEEVAELAVRDIPEDLEELVENED